MPMSNADSALKELLDGNQRYVAGKMKHPHQSTQHRRKLVPHQHPFASMLACSDSRVPPEVIFDQGLGDLFVVRVAGNIIDEEAVLGSLEYAVGHLNTPLLMVLGHRACGAVKATVDALAKSEEGEGHLPFIIHAIQPAVAEARKRPGDVVDNAVRANVWKAIEQLKQAGPILSAMVRNQKLKIVGAYYDLESGKVELLDGAS